MRGGPLLRGAERTQQPRLRLLRLDRPVSVDKRPATIARRAEPLEFGQLVHAFEFGGGVPAQSSAAHARSRATPGNAGLLRGRAGRLRGQLGWAADRRKRQRRGRLGRGNADYAETSRAVSMLQYHPRALRQRRRLYAFQAAAGLCAEAPRAPAGASRLDQPASCALCRQRGGSFPGILALPLALFYRRRRHASPGHHRAPGGVVTHLLPS